jgi:hypothetical protein
LFATSKRKHIAQPHNLDFTFLTSSLLRIFPEVDLGTLLMKVTFRNLLKGATCKTEKRIDGELKEMSALVSLSQEKKKVYIYF